jgi:hypothetical protein
MPGSAKWNVWGSAETALRQPPSKEEPDKPVNSMSRPRYTTADDEPVSGAGGDLVVDPLADSIIYLCALIADRPRAIDRYIDYFGETRPAPGVAALQKAILSNRWAATAVGRS